MAGAFSSRSFSPAVLVTAATRPRPRRRKGCLIMPRGRRRSSGHNCSLSFSSHLPARRGPLCVWGAGWNEINKYGTSAVQNVTSDAACSGANGPIRHLLRLQLPGNYVILLRLHFKRSRSRGTSRNQSFSSLGDQLSTTNVGNDSLGCI